MIDALGFKGIWQRHRGEDVLAKLEQLERDVQESLTGVDSIGAARERYGGFWTDLRVALMSDTLVVGAWTTAPPGNETNSASEFVSLLTVSGAIAVALVHGAKGPVPLAYRGCVTVGKFAMRQSFIVGPAVDRAANLGARTDGAIVWLDEQASEIIRDDEVPPWCIPAYPVPLNATKSEPAIAQSAFTINPHFGVLNDGLALRKNILSTFVGNRSDIVRKRENTDKFLQRAVVALPSFSG